MSNPGTFISSRQQPDSIASPISVATNIKASNTSNSPSSRKHDLTFKRPLFRISATPVDPIEIRDQNINNTILPDEKSGGYSSCTDLKMADTSVARPVTPSSAVQIPVNPKQNHKQHRQRHHTDLQPRRSSSTSSRNSSSSRRARDARTSEPVPASVAKVLAMTSIPPPQRRLSLRQRPRQDGRMTVDSLVPRSQVSEKELSKELDDDLETSSLPSLSRSPMDILLSPPEEREEDEASLSSDYGFTSGIPSRVPSLESVPSLGDSLGTNPLSSVDSPVTPRGRRYRAPRRSLEPVTSPPGKESEDPLSIQSPEQFDFAVFDHAPSMAKKTASASSPLRSVFKSNLTASLRALRSAARSISTFTASSIPPDDFLTRSIFTMDPKVPFTDEKMPPTLGDQPSEAMRRYLNPTNNTYTDSHTPTVRSYTASIQMQTYKVQRSRSAPPASRSESTPPSKATALVFPPGPRQREMRENSDFIRIAVMEHLMRKRGKLDDQREGHARWLLPPRKAVSSSYEIGRDGVPTRWVSVSPDTV